MKKRMRKIGAILLAAVLFVTAMTMAAFADEVDKPKVEIPVKVTLAGSVPSSPEDLVLVLTSLAETTPMPEGTADGVYKMTISGGAEYKFPAIEYERVGIYKYKIHQEPGNHSRGKYDEKVYDVHVYVTNAESGGLETTVVSYINGVGEKQSIVFANSYSAPPDSGGSTPKKPTVTESIAPTDVIEIEGEEELPFGVLGAFDELFNLLPATGDNTMIWLYALILGAGVLGLVVTVFKKEKMEE